MVLIRWSHNILSTGPLINLHSEHTAGDFGTIEKKKKKQFLYTSSYTFLKNRKNYFKTVFNLVFLHIWGKRCNSCDCHRTVTHWCERGLEQIIDPVLAHPYKLYSTTWWRTILWQARNWTPFSICQHRRGLPWTHPQPSPREQFPDAVPKADPAQWVCTAASHTVPHPTAQQKTCNSLRASCSEKEPAVVFQTLQRLMEVGQSVILIPKCPLTDWSHNSGVQTLPCGFWQLTHVLSCRLQGVPSVCQAQPCPKLAQLHTCPFWGIALHTGCKTLYHLVLER